MTVQSLSGPKCYGILYVEGIPTELHEFTLCDSDGTDFHRQRLSFNSFSRRERKRLYDCIEQRRKTNEFLMPKYRCNVAMQDAFYEQDKMSGLFGNLPVSMHDCIWDFYEAIGYDLKTKRYIRK